MAGRRPGRLSLAVAAGFIARCDLAVGGKRSKFRLHFRGAPLDARFRRVPRIPVVAAGWRNECRRLADHVTHVECAGGNFHEHVLTEDFEVFHTHSAILQPQPRYVALGASERRVAPLGNVGETCSAFHRQLSRTER